MRSVHTRPRWGTPARAREEANGLRLSTELADGFGVGFAYALARNTPHGRAGFRCAPPAFAWRLLGSRLPLLVPPFPASAGIRQTQSNIARVFRTLTFVMGAQNKIGRAHV